MKVLRNLSPDNCIFLDIETSRIVDKLEKNTPLYDSWSYKVRHGRDSINNKDLSLEDSFAKEAALYPEFGRIVCITIGKIVNNEIKLISYADHNESKLLQTFTDVMNKITASNKNSVLVGHALLGFDVPYILRRCLINGIEPHSFFDVSHLKPWIVSDTIIDTMNLWKGTGFNGGSLLAIATAFGLPNPKDDIEGKDTSDVFFSEKDGIDRIVKYCMKDVTTVANVFRKCRFEPILGISTAPVEEIKTPLLSKLFNGGKYDLVSAKTLTKEYSKLDATGKENMVILLRSIIDKNTNFTEEHLQAIINFTPKTK